MKKKKLYVHLTSDSLFRHFFQSWTLKVKQIKKAVTLELILQ